MKKLFYTIVAIIGFANLTMAQVPSYVPSDGLIGYFGFDNNANDALGSSTPSSNNAVSSSDRFGIFNAAYQFNGSNVILYNNSTHPLFKIGNVNSSFSINFWVNTSTNGNGNILGAFGWGYFVVLTNNNEIQLNYISANNPTTWTDITSLTPIAKNSWKMITISRNGTTNSIYIDGILDNVVTNAPNILVYSNNNCWFGANGQDNNNFLTGKLDDIGMWNRALTQSEITALHIGCTDTITSQPSNLSGIKGNNKTFSIAHSGTGNNYKWQSNSSALGWQNVPNAFQYAGATTNNLSINNLTVSNHNQLFRVITSKTGCADTSNIVKLTVSDVAADSLRVIQLENDLANKHDTLYVGSAITTDTLKISIHTGISSASPVINSLKVYPNPASTLLTIDLEKPGYYIAKLSSLTGQSIITPTSGTIDISSLANGVYILTIYDSNNKLISTNKVSIIK